MYVCPRPFVVSQILDDPRPTPPPDYKPNFHFTHKWGDGNIDFDLEQLDPHWRDIVVGNLRYGYEDDEFYFSAADRIGCPESKNCGIYKDDKANIWKCVNHKKDCYPLGDSAYGLDIGLARVDGPLWGVVAHYKGGAGNYSANITFMCVRGYMPGQMAIDQVAHQFTGMGAQRIVDFFVFTGNVCPGFNDQINRIKGGSIFLLIVSELFLIYFGFGMLFMFIFKKRVALPFQDFAEAFWDCLVTAILFLVCCGRKPASGGVGGGALAGPAVSEYDRM
jgi:hypothetical protein